ncbi:hypothetical protein DVB69_04625 [Sporosarcina sp. BI001-red]|uniref:hypothetical protein n=1 Tax=Sporosarcina sp. BI001-red TaxID=2282866 RepID=UPI000E26EAD2|nr:hypothetical protein [Sporosarcina sp. BI001-red]REB10094.1 hypothetical protein DVB69_04625 [Sporosarcina sp. BI001-red]
MRIMKGVLFVFVVLVAIWALITGINSFSPYMFLIVAAMMLYSGLFALKLKRKKNAAIYFIATAIALSASIYIFFT